MSEAEEIVFYINALYQKKLTTTSGGNLSIKDKKGNLWITPSGIDKGRLSVSDIIKIDTKGNYSSKHKPSMELPFHQAIYKTNPNVNAILHAHSPALVTHSITHKIPVTSLFLGSHILCGKVAFAPYGIPGSENLGQNIADAIKNDAHNVIMENHGALSIGENMQEAFNRFHSLEWCANINITAKLLNKNIESIMPETPNPFGNSHNTTAESAKQEVIDELHDFASRASKQALFNETGSTLAIRSEDIIQYTNPMTPLSKQKGSTIHSFDLHKHTPSNSDCITLILKQIFSANTAIGAAIISAPVNLSALGISKQSFDTRIIPETWMFLKNFMQIEYEKYNKDSSQFLNRIAEKNTLGIINNYAVISTGKDLLQAFDRIEVAEFSANSMVMGRNFAPLIPIDEQSMRDLQNKFGVD